MKRRVIAIMQARISSDRLPGKVLADINGRTMLWHVVNRLGHCKELDGIVVAIPKNDHKLHRYLHKYRFVNRKLIKHYLGSEDNVLERYYKAATFSNADVVVRITSDCPMIDPDIVDSVVKYYISHNFDYCCNTSDNKTVYEKMKSGDRNSISFQTMDGFDVEVFSFISLCNAYFNAKDKSDLEHVTPFIVRNGNIDVWKYNKELPKFHLSVNTAEDLDIVRQIFKKLGNKFTLEEAVDEFQKLNAIIQDSKKSDTREDPNIFKRI